MMRTSARCKVCAGEWPPLTYKDTENLRKFLTDRTKIKSRRQTHLCAYHQGKLKREVKRARILALLPFTTITTKLSPQDIKEIFGD